MASSSRFLTLPAELRNQILEDVARDTTGLIALTISPSKPRTHFPHQSLALAYVCHQTSAEYLSLLHHAVVHDATPLHIDVPDGNFAGLSKFLQSLAPLTEGGRRECRITLRFNKAQAVDEKGLVELLYFLDTSPLMSTAAMKRSYTAEIDWNICSRADAEAWAGRLGASRLFSPTAVRKRCTFDALKMGYAVTDARVRHMVEVERVEKEEAEDRALQKKLMRGGGYKRDQPRAAREGPRDTLAGRMELDPITSMQGNSAEKMKFDKFTSIQGELAGAVEVNDPLLSVKRREEESWWVIPPQYQWPRLIHDWPEVGLLS